MAGEGSAVAMQRPASPVQVARAQVVVLTTRDAQKLKNITDDGQLMRSQVAIDAGRKLYDMALEIVGAKKGSRKERQAKKAFEALLDLGRGENSFHHSLHLSNIFNYASRLPLEWRKQAADVLAEKHYWFPFAERIMSMYLHAEGVQGAQKYKEISAKYDVDVGIFGIPMAGVPVNSDPHMWEMLEVSFKALARMDADNIAKGGKKGRYLLKIF